MQHDVLESELHARYIDAGKSEAEWRRDCEALVTEAVRRQVLDERELLTKELRATGRYRPPI